MHHSIADRPQMGKPRGAARLADAALFIVGSQRSGTTWLQRLLLEDPRIVGGHESHFFNSVGAGIRQFDRMLADSRPHGLGCYWSRDAFVEEIRNLWRKTAEKVTGAKPDAELLLEKTPDHAMWVKEIADVVPRAKVVHLIRDSRAVVASLLAARKSGWGARWAPATARAAADRWVAHVREARRGREILGDARYREVFYEDLCTNPVRELLRIYSFIGLTAEPEAVARAVEQNTIEKLSQSGTVGPMVVAGEGGSAGATEPNGFYRRGKVDSWRHELTLWQRFCVWRKTRYLMTSLGYSRCGSRTG